MAAPIDSFRGNHRFLSNFHPAEVELDGETYPTVEHAYQAAKTLDASERRFVRTAASAKEAKERGQGVLKQPNWDNLRYGVMLRLLRQKFGHRDLGDLLLATQEAKLIEGNTWGDTTWGVCRGKGKNMLGVLLMQVRDELRLRKP